MSWQSAVESIVVVESLNMLERTLSRHSYVRQGCLSMYPGSVLRCTHDANAGLYKVG